MLSACAGGSPARDSRPARPPLQHYTHTLPTHTLPTHLALHSVDTDSEAPNQRVLTLELQVGRRALERLLDGLLVSLAETVAPNAVILGRGV